MKRIYILIIMIFILSIFLGIGLYNRIKDIGDINKNKKSNYEIDDYLKDKITDDTKNEQKSDINVKFTDNKCLAIGNILSTNESEFVKKYFNDFSFYRNLKVYDFRSDVEQEGNKFIIIPKNEDVKITLYASSVDDEGELVIKNNLTVTINEPFIIISDYTEYIPKICIELKYNGFEKMIPIQFSGENGHLNLVGFESAVLDISMYKNI